MKEYRLGDIIDIKHGYAFDGDHIVQEDNGIVLVTPGNFRIGGGFQEEKCKFFTGEIPDDYVLSAGDFIVTMTDLSKEIDTLGYSAIVPDTNRTYLHNQRIGLVSFKNNECHPGYIYFLMRTHQYQRSIANTSTGATVHHTSPSKICDYQFYAPSYEKQRRIAECLFVYEKLTQNNQKQIKLLEEAAQRLYKEWFVDLRFPGHETTLIVDGVPEGWKKDSLGSICTLKKNTVSAGKIPAGTPYIGLEHMPRVDFCLSSWGNAEDATSNKFQYTEDDIIFGKIRPYFHKVGFTLNSGVVSTDSLVLKANDGMWGLLLMTVFDKLFVDYTYQTCKEGAKMPRADWGQMEKYPVLIPPESVLQDFEEFIWNNTRRVKVLALQNHALAEARDRLLPKLMSGEIEV